MMPPEKRESRLFYHRLPEDWTKQEKLEFLREYARHEIIAQPGHGSRVTGHGSRVTGHVERPCTTIPWQNLVPNQEHTWLRSDTEDEFAAFVPIGSKEAKRAQLEQVQTLFKNYSLGVSTNRDMYVYDFDHINLRIRMSRFVENYNSEVDRYRRSEIKMSLDEFVNYDLLKWDNGLKRRLKSLR